MDESREEKVPTEQEMQDSVGVLMESIPQVVRDFLAGPERNKIILSLSNKYALHVDQAGVLEKALIMLLLGVENPEEFVGELQGARVPRDVIDGLTKEINERVFIPLRQKERQAAENPPAAAQEVPRPAPLPPPAITIQTPAPTPIPAPVPVAPAPLPRPPAPAPMPVQPTAFVPENLPGAPVAATPAPTVPRPSTPAQPNAARQELHDVLKSYGVDPYRETPE